MRKNCTIGGNCIIKLIAEQVGDVEQVGSIFIISIN